MTGEQAKWLTDHRAEGYRVRGQLGGVGSRWVRTGMLHADGTFDRTVPGQRPAVRQGSFEVGILEVDPPRSMPGIG